VSPTLIAPSGAAIAIVFGFLWARDATMAYREVPRPIEPERREDPPTAEAPPIPADRGEAAMPPPEPGERFPRSRFLEGATLGLGGVIGGIVTLPVAAFAVLPAFLDQEGHRVDLGPISDFTEGKWVIATFMVNPDEGETSRRTAFVRNNGAFEGKPSFTIISNRCAHLGCPVQANGPQLGKHIVEKTSNGPVTLIPVQPAGFGCPCHGGQFDTEGNRTAG